MSQPRRPRKDAVANREKLLDTAMALLGSRDGDISVSELAAASGMGVGTAYRHFADRDALVRALYDRQVEGLASRVGPALEGGTPWETLSRLIAGSVLNVADNPAQRAVMRLMYDLDPHYMPAEHILDSLAALIAAAQEEGTLRSEVDATDIVLFVYSMGRLAGFPEQHEREALLRVVTFFLDGLRADGGRTELATDALSRDDLHSITHRSNATRAVTE